MSADPPIRAELLRPLRRSLDWMLSLRDRQGRILCPEHGVEHTGKSAGALLTAVRLVVDGDPAEREALVAVAVQQGRRLVGNLVREGTSPCHTFRPGRHDPFNCSNSVIDGGAASDALAELVLVLGPQLETADREAFQHASVLHARTYLRYAVLDKGVPAQRAWGLTGLAGAHALEPDEEFERAGMEAVGVLEGIQHPDGSYPYHPLAWGAPHAGSADVSSYYQSRVSAFLMFALERFGRDPTDPMFATPILRGLDFLLALQGPDGIKVGLVEAKPWYWGATYEVASHPFDIYALARAATLYGRPRAGAAALRAYRAWSEHLDARGAPRSHLQGPGRSRSYQCPVFWAGHASWIARALPDLERAAAASDRPEPPGGTGTGIDLSVRYFPNAGLGRLEDGHVVAWIRGPRPPFTVHHGSPHGAGLLRVVRKGDGAELLERCPLGGHQAAEWSGHAGLPSLARGWAGGGSELRFSSWIARTHLRAGRRGEALRTPLETLKRGVLAFGSARVSSAFYLVPEVRVRADGIELVGGLAWRGGRAVPGARLARSFQVDGEGLVVGESLQAKGSARGLRYQVPRQARDVALREGHAAYRLA